MQNVTQVIAMETGGGMGENSPACPTWNRMVLGERLKLEMFAPSLIHWGRGGGQDNVILRLDEAAQTTHNAQSPLQQQQLLHNSGNVRKQEPHKSFCHFQSPPVFYAGASFTGSEETTDLSDDSASCSWAIHPQSTTEF